MPRIGVISGATIIAPITVAVESATTPEPAMIAASRSSTQNAERWRGVPRNSRSTMRSTSAPVTPGSVAVIAVRPPVWRHV